MSVWHIWRKHKATWMKESHISKSNIIHGPNHGCDFSGNPWFQQICKSKCSLRDQFADPRLSDISSFYLLQPPFTSLNPTQELFLYFNLNCAREKIESHKLKVIFLYLFNIITWNICYFYITELAQNLE